MSISYTSEDVFTEYDDRESKLIEEWLSKHDYTWWQPTLCGNCCGMYTGYYRVNDIGGKWKTDQDKIDFAIYAKKNNIPFDEDELNHSTISPVEA